MPPSTLEQFGKDLVGAGVVSADELRSLWKSLPAADRPRTAPAFAAVLQQHGLISDYQRQVALQGKAATLAFGNYVLSSQLGTGASGHVFRAKHKTSGREAAIKVLAAEVAKDEKAVKRFHREVQATARLTHPNIVRAFDAGEFKGSHYLIMEYVAGRDLSSTVKSDGPLTPELAARCILQAAEGLAYAHAAGIIHRDIKPGNLLLDERRNVRILDLGLVRFEEAGEATGDGLTGTQQVMGTIDYMSPEQVVDTRHADARCDVYSLGCTLWFLLTGRKLYEGKGLVDRIMAHRSAAIPSLVQHCPAASPQLAAIFQKMVAKSPDERFQTMTEVGRALRRYLDGQADDVEWPNESATEPQPTVAEANFASAQVADAKASVGDVAIVTAPSIHRPTVAATPAGIVRRPNRYVLLGGGAIIAVLLLGGLAWRLLTP